MLFDLGALGQSAQMSRQGELIADLPQRQPVGWRHGGHAGSRFGDEGRCGGSRSGEATANVVEEADDGSDHLMTKGIRLDPRGEVTPLLLESQLDHPTNIALPLDCAAESREVVLADEDSAGGPHRIEIELTPHMPDVASMERVLGGCHVDRVPVPPPNRREPGIEVRGCRRHRSD